MKNYSRQREAIVRVLLDSVEHPTAEQIYAEVKNSVPNISLATVYRNLKELDEEAEIISLHTDDKTHYDGNVFPHAHFLCTECGKVYDIMLDNNQIAALMAIKPCSDFRLNYYGVCERCKNK